MDINKYIGNKIRELREKKNLTQEEIAEYLNTTPQTISRYEKGDRKTNQDILYRLADYFKVSINEFFPPIDYIATDMINDTLGDKYITETQLSLITGINISEIRKIKNGEEKVPNPSTLIKIAEATNQDPYDFLIGAGYVEEPQDKNNDLYNIGIRFLLPESERIVLCEYLEKIWNKNSNKKITSAEIYKAMFEQDKCNFSIKDVKKILDFNNKLNVNFDNATPIELPKRIVKIPVLGTIKAGIPIEAQQDILEYVDIPEEWTRGGKEFYGLKISGDSMEPKYNENDIVIFEHTQDYSIANNKDCAVMVNGDDATFKNVSISEAGLTLIPGNLNNSDGYKPTFYSIEQIENLPVKIIGIAREIRRRDI